MLVGSELVHCTYNIYIENKVYRNVGGIRVSPRVHCKYKIYIYREYSLQDKYRGLLVGSRLVPGSTAPIKYT